MKLLTTLCFAVVACILGPTAALADDAARNAKIDEMLRVTHADQMLTQMLTQVLSQMQASTAKQFASVGASSDASPQAAQLQQKLMAVLAERLSWEKAKPAMVKMYAETFTESEIDGILAFYKSPAGQAMLQKMPLLIQKSMQVGQQLVGDVMPELKRMSEEAQPPAGQK